MTTVTVGQPAKSAGAAQANDFAGTRALVRLALRRDRIILSMWGLLLGILPAATLSQFDKLYPNPADRMSLNATMGADPSISVIYGPAFDLSTAGGFTAWRFLGVLSLLLGLIVVFTVTRHTRAEEDTGRAELLSSTVVGRYAALTAAILVGAGASVLIGALQAVTLTAAGGPASGSWLFGMSMTGVGLCFTASAAIAVQLAEYSRTANGIGAAVIGFVFLLRALGDSTTDATWLSWLSPIGWAQRAQPYAGNHWWVLILPLVLSVALASIGYALLRRRDLGTGILPPRPGPATAANSLGSPLALSWRLQRGSLIGWAVGIAVIGGTFGSIANGFGNLVGASDATRKIMAQLGGSGAIVQAFLAMMTGLVGMVAAIYGAQATLRIRTEEVSVRVEPLLATRVGRLRFISSHLVFAFLGTALLAAIGGCAMALTHGLRSGDLAGAFGDVFAGTLVQLPAVWLVVGVCVLLYGFVPKYSMLIWGVVALAMLLKFFGPLLQLPQLILDISPFTHVPQIPGHDMRWLPLIVLAALAIGAVGAGLAAFRQRDIG